MINTVGLNQQTALFCTFLYTKAKETFRLCIQTMTTVHTQRVYLSSFPADTFFSSANQESNPKLDATKQNLHAWGAKATKGRIKCYDPSKQKARPSNLFYVTCIEKSLVSS